MTQAAWRKYSEWPLLAAAVVFLVAYSIQVIANLTERQSAVLDAVILATWALFVADYVVNLILAERRWRWFSRNLHEVLLGPASRAGVVPASSEVPLLSNSGK